jgi:2,5-diketo-D-gluconate reductase B
MSYKRRDDQEAAMSIYFQKTFQRGFGTWPLRGETLHAAIGAALAAGYRALDTAQMYGNEAEVGEALAACGLPRDELCITTKVHPENFGADRFIAAVERSLKDLRVDQVDVLLLHWPPAGGDVAPSLRLLAEAHRRGLARHVGVSNYTIAMLREAVRIVDAPLATNQVEFHPLLDQSRLMAAANELGVPLSSYSSVARGEVFKYPDFAEIGAAYGKSAAQVVLRWILQKGVSLNTMSTKPENIRANFDVMDFTLSSVDMARIERLTRTGYRVVVGGTYEPVWD